VPGGVLEAADLVVLGEQVPDGVEHQVDQPVAAPGGDTGHVAHGHLDVVAAPLLAHPVSWARLGTVGGGVLNGIDLMASQRTPTSPRRPLEDTARMEPFRSSITPVLTVRDAARAVDFYQRAFGAEEIYRNAYADGRIVAELAVEGARFRVADEAPEASNLSPQALSGTTVRINLLVADPDQLAERAIANGAIEIAPIADQAYGLRQGRLADPFGHHWLVGRPLAGETGDWARR
jgi:PhnB protein